MMPRVREPRALQLNFSILRLNFRVPLGCGHPSFARDDQIPATKESDVIALKRQPIPADAPALAKAFTIVRSGGMREASLTIPIHSWNSRGAAAPKRRRIKTSVFHCFIDQLLKRPLDALAFAGRLLQ